MAGWRSIRLHHTSTMVIDWWTGAKRNRIIAMWCVVTSFGAKDRGEVDTAVSKREQSILNNVSEEAVSEEEDERPGRSRESLFPLRV